MSRLVDPYMRMKQLPVSYEQLRSLMLEAFGKLQPDPQIGVLHGLVGQLACEKNLVPDPNGAEPDRHAMYFMDNRDVARVDDIFWDLLIEGIIRPGLGQGTGNHELPSFHVTEYGKDQIKHGTGSPHDPDGYLSRLQASVPALDAVITTCMNECLRTFRIGCLLSSAVMLGCASEKALLLLIDAYATALPAVKEWQFRKKIEGKFIKTQYEEFNNMLDGHLTAQIPSNLNDGLAAILLGVFEMIRAERNDAGHPTGKIPSRELAFANISVFPSYIKRIYDLISWLQTKNPGGLA